MEYRAGARVCYALGAFLLLVPTTCLGWLLGGEIDKALSAPNWPTTTGTIIGSKVGTSTTGSGSMPRGTQSVAIVEYEYEVDGTEYYSPVVNIMGVGHEDPQTVVNRYPLGSEVTVHYDPDDPSEATLDTDMGPQPYYAAAMIASPTIFGLVFLALGVVVARKGRSRAGGASGEAINGT